MPLTIREQSDQLKAAAAEQLAGRGARGVRPEHPRPPRRGRSRRHHQGRRPSRIVHPRRRHRRPGQPGPDRRGRAGRDRVLPGRLVPLLQPGAAHLPATSSSRNSNTFDARLVAISPQSPDESLSTVEKAALEFTVLSDPGSRLAERIGIAFQQADEVLAAQRTARPRPGPGQRRGRDPPAEADCARRRPRPRRALRRRAARLHRTHRSRRHRRRAHRPSVRKVQQAVRKAPRSTTSAHWGGGVAASQARPYPAERADGGQRPWPQPVLRRTDATTTIFLRWGTRPRRPMRCRSSRTWNSRSSRTAKIRPRDGGPRGRHVLPHSVSARCC